MIYYCYIKTPLGRLLAVKGDNGLEQILFPCNEIKPSDKEKWIEEPKQLKNIADEIDAYFNKELKSFTIKLNINGTPFQKNVWHELLKIPFGTTVSYKAIAERIDKPKGYRAAGRAVANNPIPIIIPCHRVIGSDGSLTGFAGGLDIKHYLLNLEKSLF